MRVGWPFREPADITSTDIQPDGRYLRIMVQRHVVQSSSRHALVCTESIGRPEADAPFLLFHLQNWERSALTGFWWPKNSFPLIRSRVDLLTGIVNDLRAVDPDELMRDGLARAKALAPGERLP